MPKTEHDAPSCQELREALLKVADLVAKHTPSPTTQMEKDLRRLASAPTLEERLMVNEVRAEDALLEAIENAETEDDFEEEEYRDAMSWAYRTSEERAEHARKLKAAQEEGKTCDTHEH